MIRRIGWVGLMSAGAASAAEASPYSVGPERSASYRITAEFVENDCVYVGKADFNRLINIVQEGDRFYLFDPMVEPENLGIPVIAVGHRAGDSFHVENAEWYRLRYLDRLHVVQRIDGKLLNGGQRFEADMRVEATAPGAEPGQEALADKVRELYHVPCRAQLRIRGEAIPSRTFDKERRVAIWNLLKNHMDLLMRQKPIESLAPLEEGLALEGDHHPAFLWRKARGFYVAGEMLPLEAKEERIRTFTAGLEAAEAALRLKPDSGEALFFRSANKGRLNTTQGLLKTVLGLEDFEKGCLAAIDQNAAGDMFGFRVIGDAHFAWGSSTGWCPTRG